MNVLQIVNCVDLAIQRATDVSELINSVIADDNIKRSKRQEIGGFSELISLNENHILIGRKETEPRDEDKMLLEQVQSIASVNTTENVQKAGRSELDEVNELLEGIEEEFGCAGD
ncbi:unnamed protein product [Gongylonema pulchrum]|uniref:Coil containing protein n=1 Tax=Gongylonema pulchrum TaxID=637853 RepID=A0A183EFY5_9BILA|nr:unnamed protein product [Gongylonema pulchrum]